MNKIIEYFKNGSEVKRLKLENKDIKERLFSLEDIKRKYNKGDYVYFWQDERNDKAIEAEIIGFASGVNKAFIICREVNYNNIYLKCKNQLINIK